MVTCDLRIFE